MSTTESANEVQTITPPKKRPQRKPLSRGEKHMVLNSYKVEVERNPAILLSDIVSNTACATGVSERSVYRVIREYKTIHELKSPKKSKPRKKLIENIDDFDKNAIRRKVHEFYFRNELPTIDKVMAIVNEDEDLPTFRRTTFYKLLKDMNFKYVRRGRDSTLIDRDDIVIWRRNYLKTVKLMRQEGRRIYYIDETWLNAGHTKSRVWKDETIKSAKQAFLSGLSVGNKAPSGKGSRLIITHIGSDTGFVEGGLWIFKSNKSGDYHEEMNAESFERWFATVLPLLEDNSVIVLDNAPYHCRKREKLPNNSWSKNNIKIWLTSKGIPFEDDILKAQLVHIAQQNKDKYNVYSVDEMAQLQNKTILRLPPYHCELNPIELIWAQIKNFVASKNTTFKLPDVKNLCLQAINKTGVEEWNNCVKHITDSVEKKLWDLDNIMENAVEPLIISVNSGSGSSNDSFSSSDEN
jgi:transposase/DNA-directed RNA polymerase subunit H (RpoH/RPB5)